MRLLINCRLLYLVLFICIFENYVQTQTTIQTTDIIDTSMPVVSSSDQNSMTQASQISSTYTPPISEPTSQQITDNSEHSTQEASNSVSTISSTPSFQTTTPAISSFNPLINSVSTQQTFQSTSYIPDSSSTVQSFSSSNPIIITSEGSNSNLPNTVQSSSSISDTLSTSEAVKLLTTRHLPKVSPCP